MTKSIELILSFLSEFGKCFSRKIAFYRFSGYVLACILSRSMIFENDRFFGGNYEKLPPNNKKKP
jgi:hypothetical protein